MQLALAVAREKAQEGAQVRRREREGEEGAMGLTFACSLASTRAVAIPIPLDAPVTRTALAQQSALVMGGEEGGKKKRERVGERGQWCCFGVAVCRFSALSS